MLKMTLTGTATLGGFADQVALQLQCCISMCHGKQDPWFEVNGIVLKHDIHTMHLYHEHGHDIPALGREEDETPW